MGETNDFNHSSAIKIFSPGLIDATGTKKEYERTIKEYQNSEEPRSTSLDSIFDDRRKIISFLDDIAAGDGVGSVICASGLKSTNANNRRIDWALVELHNPELIRPNKPVTMIELQPYQRPQYLNMLLKNSVVTEICDISTLKEGTLYKRGRNGLSTGKPNALDSMASWDDGMVTSEMSALPLTGEPHTRLGFIGDAGSMVHDDDGKWVEMIVSMNTSTGTTHITSAPELVAAVKQATGGDIYLPTT